MIEIKNAIITKTTLTIEDHGCLMGWIILDYGGAGQGFGGHNLCTLPELQKDYKQGVAGHFICRILQIAGVTKWDQLLGKTIRVKCENNMIKAIGHIVKDDWFNPKIDFENM